MWNGTWFFHSRVCEPDVYVRFIAGRTESIEVMFEEYLLLRTRAGLGVSDIKRTRPGGMSSLVRKMDIKP